MGSQGSSACQGLMESEGFLESLGKEALPDWMETLENWACQAPPESPASLVTWECWVRLATQDPRA